MIITFSFYTPYFLPSNSHLCVSSASFWVISSHFSYWKSFQLYKVLHNNFMNFSFSDYFFLHWWMFYFVLCQLCKLFCHCLLLFLMTLFSFCFSNYFNSAGVIAWPLCNCSIIWSFQINVCWLTPSSYTISLVLCSSHELVFGGQVLCILHCLLH